MDDEPLELVRGSDLVIVNRYSIGRKGHLVDRMGRIKVVQLRLFRDGIANADLRSKLLIDFFPISKSQNQFFHQ